MHKAVSRIVLAELCHFRLKETKIVQNIEDFEASKFYWQKAR